MPNEEDKYVSELRSRLEEAVSKERLRGRTLLGSEIKTKPKPLKDLAEEDRNVTAEGYIFNRQEKKTKTGRTLLNFGISDNTNSLPCQIFIEEGIAPPTLTEGQWYLFRGDLKVDTFTHELTLFAKDIENTNQVNRYDQADVKRVELHLHTRMSEMDGMNSAEDLIGRAVLWGHDAIAITDHGVVQAFPEAAKAAAAHRGKIKVIFGMEGYLQDGTAEEKPRYAHIILLAKDKVGLKNLYRLVTESHLHHYHRRPRLPRELLVEHREGLIIGSACEAGELFQALLADAPPERLREIASFYDYLEVQPIANNAFLVRDGRVKNDDALRELNRRIIELGESMGLPVVATGDVHFLEPESEVYRRILMAGRGFEDADNQAPLYYRTTEEMLAEFDWLGAETAHRLVIANPRAIAAGIEEMKPYPETLHPPVMPEAEAQIQSMAWQRAKEWYGEPLPPLVEATLSKELNAIITHGFSVLYYIAHLLVKKSNEDGYMVGSRGSVGSSLVATLTGITEVNPLPPHYRCPACRHTEFITGTKALCGADLPEATCPGCGTPLIKDGHNIPFETFLGFDGDKTPDIDLNFSGEYQARAHKYVEEIFGRENVFRAGTIATVQKKTAYGFVKKYHEERELLISPLETERMSEGCTGVKRTTGQHPGGLMVKPREVDIHDFTPLQRPANKAESDVITTHFEYGYIHDCLVKLDLLGHDAPTMIRMLEDLTGVPALGISLADPQTLSLFSGTKALGVRPEEIGVKTGTLGVPEFGTRFVRQMLEEIKPTCFAHLVSISGLSHGTNVWTGNAQDIVRTGSADIGGIICCRDDIMTYLIDKGLEPKLAFKVMESVRKGKGVALEWLDAMRELDIPNWYLPSCQKIKYLFPKAHAVAYVTMAFRIAWYKVNYPEEFYACSFTVRAADFDADIICQGADECRRAMRELMSKDKGKRSATEEDLCTTLELAVEMYARGIKLSRVDLQHSAATRFLPSPEGLLPPFCALSGVGPNAAKQLEEFREQGEIFSQEDMQVRGHIPRSVIEVLGRHGALAGLPESNQLSLF
jgi:DNA polymerase-3 subunit alpha (Gram-positive type)